MTCRRVQRRRETGGRKRGFQTCTCVCATGGSAIWGTCSAVDTGVSDHDGTALLIDTTGNNGSFRIGPLKRRKALVVLGSRRCGSAGRRRRGGSVFCDCFTAALCVVSWHGAPLCFFFFYCSHISYSSFYASQRAFISSRPSVWCSVLCAVCASQEGRLTRGGSRKGARGVTWLALAPDDRRYLAKT
jgi:hypothetical protein